MAVLKLKMIGKIAGGGDCLFGWQAIFRLSCGEFGGGNDMMDIKKKTKSDEGLLNMIRVAMKRYPDMRLCQLLSNAAISGGWQDKDLFHLKDAELYKALSIFICKGE